MTKRSSSLQRLFVACRDVFKGPGTVLHHAFVTKLCLILVFNYQTFRQTLGGLWKKQHILPNYLKETPVLTSVSDLLHGGCSLLTIIRQFISIKAFGDTRCYHLRQGFGCLQSCRNGG